MGGSRPWQHPAWQRWQGWRPNLPSRCAICRAWPAQPICDTCIARFAQPCPRCQGCALPVPRGVLRCGACLAHPPPLAHCLCALSYAWPWRGLIAHFKYHAQPGWDRSLTWLMRGCDGAQDLLHAVDTVLPMPLARERLAERGYNQAWLLARRLAPDQADAGLLLRVRHTPPQRSLPRSARLANVQGAFAVEPLRARELQGRHCLLVDDVMTSGASLHSAAQTLLRAGAARVSALVLARTEAHHDDHEGP
ncbi:MAG: ComF family protein [Betaproteobacteria bacterium]|nr:ComF family protein [Betaproteobacteria bacterium]